MPKIGTDYVYYIYGTWVPFFNLVLEHLKKMHLRAEGRHFPIVQCGPYNTIDKSAPLYGLVAQ